jgi:cell division septal protein FtsQ
MNIPLQGLQRIGTNESIKKTQSKLRLIQKRKKQLKKAIQNSKKALNVLALFFFIIFSTVLSVWSYREIGGLVLRKVECNGQDLLTRNNILRAANIRTGHPIEDIDLKDIRSKIQNLREIETVSVKIQFPNTLVIQVSEATPIIRLIQKNNKQLLLSNNQLQSCKGDCWDLPLWLGNDVPTSKQLTFLKTLKEKHVFNYSDISYLSSINSEKFELGLNSMHHTLILDANEQPVKSLKNYYKLRNEHPDLIRQSSTFDLRFDNYIYSATEVQKNG